MSIFRRTALVTAPVALLALAGCATGFRADVARFQALPAPQGESFAIVAQDPDKQGGLEFSQYAGLVAQRLAEEGYNPATSIGSATLLVKLDYGVDNGRERVRSSPGFGGGFYGSSFYGGGFGRRGFGGFGRRGYAFGFHDPFLFGSGYNDVYSVTVYTSDLDLVIERKGDGRRLFEGSAKAMSRSDDLPYLVPNLIEAMFTGFPGNSGETVEITVAPPERERR